MRVIRVISPSKNREIFKIKNFENLSFKQLRNYACKKLRDKVCKASAAIMIDGTVTVIKGSEMSQHAHPP